VAWAALLLGDFMIAFSITGIVALAGLSLRSAMIERGGQGAPVAALPGAAARGGSASLDGLPAVAILPGNPPEEGAGGVQERDGATENASASTTSADADFAQGAITRLVIPSIGLDSNVVPAKYSSRDGGTWDIPAFKVGHAQFTPGAGDPGNAVLFGHVTSLAVGHVFRDLDRVKVGDVVDVYGPTAEFRYRVVWVRAVSRDDVSVLAPTTMPSATLITCTGNWLPLERDYDQRLVVRAEIQKGSSRAAA